MSEGVTFQSVRLGPSRPRPYSECPFCDCAYGPGVLWRGWNGYDCPCCKGAGFVDDVRLATFRLGGSFREMVFGDIMDFQEYLKMIYAAGVMHLWICEHGPYTRMYDFDASAAVSK